MSFLQPLLLTLGLAAAVPLLLHLMRRRLGTRIEFPAARYLARAEEEHSRRLRLRNLALMLLRVLLILLVALAAARPIGRLAGAGHPATALAVVLDNSLSTGAVVDGTPVLAELSAAASQVLARGTADDRLWLVTADGRVQGGSAATLAAAAAAVTPAGGAGDLPAAVERAAALVREAGLPSRQVVVVTDGQATSWARAAEPSAVPVVAYHPSSPPPANRGVTLAEARPPRFTPRGTIILRIAGGDSATYAVSLGERVVARGAVVAGELAVIRATAPDTGWIAGAVTLPPDELRGDDVRHLAVRAGPPPAVRIDASAGSFVPPAVDALLLSGLVRRGSEVSIASADAADRLPALLVAPADPVRLGAANRNLERLGVPWRFAAPRRGSVALSLASSDGPAREPSAAAGVAAGGPPPGSAGTAADAAWHDVGATLHYPLVPVAGAGGDTLVRAAGAPWAVAGDGFVLVGSPLLPDATTLPLRAAFVPWLGEVLGQRLSAEPMVLRTAAPGAPVAVPPSVTAWTPASGGSATSVVDGSLTAPAEPGVYYLLRGAARVGALVVDPEPEESVLQRLSPATLRSRLGARRAEVTTDRDRLAATAFDPAGGRSLASPLLAAALLVLVAEGWVSRRGGGGRA